MHRMFAVLLLGLCVTSALFAADAAAATPAQTELPVWLQVVVTALGTLITLVVTPLLHKMTLASEAEAQKLAAEAVAAKAAGTYSILEQRKLISERLKAFLLRGAASIAEKRWPMLAASVVAGKFAGTPDERKAAIKAELRSWGADLKKEAISYFEGQGIDLIEEMGDKALDHLIEWAANSTSPFPGKESAVALLENNVSNMVVSHGVEFVRNWFSKRNATSAATPVAA